MTGNRRFRIALVSKASGSALSPVSGRCCYAGVAEVSVYVAEAARGQGIGRALLQAVIEESETAGIWTLQGGCFPENEASIRLQPPFQPHALPVAIVPAASLRSSATGAAGYRDRRHNPLTRSGSAISSQK